MRETKQLADIFKIAHEETYNVNQLFDLPDYMEVPQNHERRSGRIVPKRMDGFAVANGKTFATISVRNYKERVWTTSVSQLYGPDYSHRIARESYAYGGNYTSPFPFHDFLLHIDGTLFRPDQTRARRSRRVFGAAIVNASMAVRGIDLDTINFCPMAPATPALIRLIRVKNTGPVTRKLRVLSYFGFDENILSLPSIRITDTGFEASFAKGVLRVCAVQESAVEVCGMEGKRALWEEIYRQSERGGERQFTSKFDSMLKYASYDAYEKTEEDKSIKLPTGSTINDLCDLAIVNDFDYLSPGEEKFFSLYLLSGRDASETQACEDNLSEKTTSNLFVNTLTFWKNWSNKPKVSTSSVHVDHLIDSVKVLIKTHQLHEDGFSTSMNFFGFRSWIRDNYYLGRTLLKIGKPEEARRNLDFFYTKWKKDGICEHYPFEETGRVDIWNLRTEGPALLALMLRDYHAYTNDSSELLRFSDMATETVKELSFSPNGLQPLCGSETYRFTTITDPWAENPDNTFSSVCALEFAADILTKKDPGSDEGPKLQSQAEASRKAIGEYLVYDGRYVHYRSKDGSLDRKLITNILTRPLIVGFTDPADPIFRKGINDVWDNNYKDGLLRCDPNFYLVPGNTVGFMLYCLAELDSIYGGICFESLLRMASCTGTFFEFYDIYDSRITNERLRLWDSATILEGVYHFLFGLQPVEDKNKGIGIEVAPHVGVLANELKIDSFPIHGNSYTVDVTRSEMRVQKNGREIVRANKPLRVQLYEHSITAKPVGFFLPELSGKPLHIEINDGGPVATGGEYLGDLELAVDLNGRKVCYQQKIVDGNLERRMDSEVYSNSFPHSDSEKSTVQIQIVLVNDCFQKVQFIEPGAEYWICGQVKTSSGTPYVGWVHYTSSLGTVDIKSDMYGYFRVPVEVSESTQCKEFIFNVEVEGAKVSLSQQISFNPFAHFDNRINRFEKRMALLCNDDSSFLQRRVLYEIWKQVMLANGTHLPVVTNPSYDGDLITTISSDHALKAGTVGTLLLKDENLSIYERGEGQGCCYVVEIDPDVTVSGNATAFVEILKSRSSGLYRQYRDWKEHRFIPLYEYNATMRDVRILQEVGSLPESAKIEVSIDASVPCYIGEQESKIGSLEFGKGQSHRSKRTQQAYVWIYEGEGDFIRTLTGFGCTEVIKKLVIQADAYEASPFQVSVKVCLPQTTFFLETPFPLYFDGGKDQMFFYRGKEGEHILEVIMSPGKLLQETKSRADRTLRKIEVAVGGLKPDWM